MRHGRDVVIVGSGAGGSAAAWALVHAGYHVTILEKGRNLLPGIGTKAGPRTHFGNDEVKAIRNYENPDELLEPRTSRTQAEAAQGVDRSFVGDVNGLPTTVGGGTVHWDAKTPRFWKQDFKTLSTHGPVPGANMADWPLAYEELAPFYDEVEHVIGCQGDVKQIPKFVLDQAPRAKQFPMPPGPEMYGGSLLAEGARSIGLNPYRVSQAVHSQPWGFGQACNNCGFCSGFGCPINARGGALSFLHEALLKGAKLKTRCFVHRVRTDRAGKKAVGVDYLDVHGRKRHQRADIVILAPSAIETARLLLLSKLAGGSGQLGRNLMFHNFTAGIAQFSEDVHAWRGPSTTITIDDFCIPEKGSAAKAAGLPYLKGGICETGGTLLPFDEMGVYAGPPNSWGVAHKNLMRTSPLRVHMAGLSMVGEDLPQLANRVDLDPKIRDVYGFPVARITYSLHNHELAASHWFGAKIADLCKAAPGALDGTYIPLGEVAAGGGDLGALAAGAATTAHIMGTARMGHDPKKSVCDAHGRVHGLKNLYLGDGSVFVSAGGFNPSLTIMSLSLRMARHVAATH